MESVLPSKADQRAARWRKPNCGVHDRNLQPVSLGFFGKNIWWSIYLLAITRAFATNLKSPSCPWLPSVEYFHELKITDGVVRMILPGTTQSPSASTEGNKANEESKMDQPPETAGSPC
jgi:hypothetical protein